MSATTRTNTNGRPVGATLPTNLGLSNHPKTTTGKVVGGPPLPLPLHDEIFKIGFETARASLSEQVRPDDQARVEKLCRAIARQGYRQPYDPTNDVHDNKVEAENERNKLQREKLEEQIDYAAKAVREARREKAGLPPADKPSIPMTIMLLAAMLVATSLSPTFSDFFFFTISDDGLRWFYSIGAGALIGFMISWAALRYVDVKGGNNASGLLNGFLIGAFLLALALGGIRLANATTSTAIYFALALTGMELSIFIILEFLARSFRSAFHQYQERKDAQSSAEQKIEGAAEHQLDVIQQKIAKQAEIDSHYEYVEWRKISHDNIDLIEDAAGECGVAGYRTGIAENHKERVMP